MVTDVKGLREKEPRQEEAGDKQAWPRTDMLELGDGSAEGHSVILPSFVYV